MTRLTPAFLPSRLEDSPPTPRRRQASHFAHRVTLSAACLFAPALMLGCSEISISSQNSDPTAKITSHDQGDQVLKNQPTLFRGNANDPDVGPTDLLTTWLLDGLVVCNGAAPSDDGSTTCEITFPGGSNGKVTLEVRDDRRATAARSVTVEVMEVIGGVPVVTLIDPEQGSEAEFGAPVTFKAQVIDIEDGPTELRLEWISNIDGTFSEQGADSSGTATFISADLSAGLHTIELQVSDTDLNMVTALTTLHVVGAPTAPEVSITPNPATSGDDLIAVIDVESEDPEGDGVSYRYEWQRNGATAAAQTNALVSASMTARGDNWTVRVYPNDGSVEGEPGTASVEVGNSPPRVEVELTPGGVTTDGEIMANITAFDPDGDEVSLDTTWFVDDTPIGASGDTLDGTLWFEVGQEIFLEVTPSDPSATGDTVRSNTVIVVNAPPTGPTVAILPVDPEEGVDDLLCVVELPSTDEDRDPISYSISWTVDTSPYPRAGDAGPMTTTLPDDTVPAEDIADGEHWVCTMTPSDGIEPGPPGVAVVTIGEAVLEVDYTGLFELDPMVSYICRDTILGGKVVDFVVPQFVFTDSAYGLTVAGAPTAMRQIPSPTGPTFSVSGEIAGGCTETYQLSGSFADEDSFAGIFQLSFTGWQCGLTDCSNQVWPVSGARL
jgi:hypothetical protein